MEFVLVDVLPIMHRSVRKCGDVFRQGHHQRRYSGSDHPEAPHRYPTSSSKGSTSNRPAKRLSTATLTDNYMACHQGMERQNVFFPLRWRKRGLLSSTYRIIKYAAKGFQLISVDFKPVSENGSTCFRCAMTKSARDLINSLQNCSE
jgi:hypothetical protein